LITQIKSFRRHFAVSSPTGSYFRYSEFLLFPYAIVGFAQFSIEKKDCLELVMQSHTLEYAATKALPVRFKVLFINLQNFQNISLERKSLSQGVLKVGYLN
jgi:hypothetical protein